MKRALALVESDEATKQLVREAGELAAGVGAELILLHVTTEEEFNDQVDAMAAIPDAGSDYAGVGTVREGARQFAEDIGREVFEGIDVDYRAVGRIGDIETEILDLAEEEGCDHIFIRGEKRSPTGKAIFGDLAQSVILDFDGAVTVVTV